MFWVFTYLAFEQGTATFSIFFTCALLWISNKLHEAFHIRDHWLERWSLTREWFLARRGRHFLHHYKPLKNMSLGGIKNIADHVLGTYAEVPEGKIYR
jgi:hypothetical protein